MPVIASSVESRDRPASSGLLRSWGRTLSDKDSNTVTENSPTAACSTPGASSAGTPAGQTALAHRTVPVGSVLDSSKEVVVVKELASAKASLEGHRQPLTGISGVGAVGTVSSHRLAEVDKESRDLYGENNLLPPKAR